MLDGITIGRCVHHIFILSMFPLKKRQRSCWPSEARLIVHDKVRSVDSPRLIVMMMMVMMTMMMTTTRMMTTMMTMMKMTIIHGRARRPDGL